MHTTIDVWIETATIVPNHSQSGIRVEGDGGYLNLFLGHTTGEIEEARKRLNFAIDELLKVREAPPEPRRE